jgi:hypothetical protein
MHVRANCLLVGRVFDEGGLQHRGAGHHEKDSQRFNVDGRTKLRAVVGKGAGAFVMMSRLPIRVRDRLMRSALGLNEALKPAN